MTSTEPFVGTLIGAGWEETQALGEDRAFVVRIRLDGPVSWPMQAVWQAWPVTVSRAEPSSPTPDGVIKERDGRRPDGPGLSHSVSSPSAAEIERLADDYVLRVSEWDDRTSPEDWPEALLITRGELKCELIGFVRELYEASASLVQPPSSQESGVGEPGRDDWCYDMDLAPRDHTHVLLTVPNQMGGNRDHVGEARFNPEANGGTWWWAGESEGDYYAEPISAPPIAWRHLPAPAAPRPSQREG